MIDLLAAIGNPGTGETNVRVFIAAIVGPKRLAHGMQQSFRLQRGQSVKVAGNKSNSKQAAYCAVSLRQGATAPGTAAVLFDSGQSMGAANSVPAVLIQSATQSQLSPFEAVLLPNDQLYAQLVDGAVAEVDVLVSTVYV